MKNRSTASLFVLALVFSLVGTSQIAYSAGGSPVNFEDRKAEQLRRLDQRLTRLREERACVQAAASQDAIKSCRQQLKAGNKQRRQQL